MSLMAASRNAGFGLALLGVLLLASLVALWESAPAVPPGKRADGGTSVSQGATGAAPADAVPAAAGAATPSPQIDPFKLALASRAALASPPQQTSRWLRPLRSRRRSTPSGRH